MCLIHRFILGGYSFKYKIWLRSADRGVIHSTCKSVFKSLWHKLLLSLLQSPLWSLKSVGPSQSWYEIVIVILNFYVPNRIQSYHHRITRFDWRKLVWLIERSFAWASIWFKFCQKFVLVNIGKNYFKPLTMCPLNALIRYWVLSLHLNFSWQHVK